MEICHTEHSHIIGKAGNNIKNVMRATGCHIHFPDTNKGTVTGTDKSNQVHIIICDVINVILLFAFSFIRVLHFIQLFISEPFRAVL